MLETFGCGTSRRLAQVGLLFVSLMRGVQAQVPGQPPGTGLIPPPSSPLERVIPTPQPTVQPKPEETPLEAAPLEAGSDIRLVDVVVGGSTVYSPAELRAFFAALVGKTVPRSAVADAVRALQKRYRDDGYFLTVVGSTFEPGQGGTLVRVQVTEGYISDVKIDGDIGPAGVLVYNFLAHLAHIRPTRLSDVERYVLLAQSVPGVSIRTILRPAKEEPGAVELIAQIQKKNFDYVAIDDNRGPRTAGPNEMVVGAAANSFTNLGEHTQAFIFNTPFDPEQVFGELSFEGFLGSGGLKFKGYTGYGKSVPGNVLAATGFQSDVLLAGASTSYPVILTRRLALNLTAALDFSQSQISLLGANGELQPNSKSKLRIIRLSEDLKVQDDLLGEGRAAANTFDVTVHRGVPFVWGEKSDAPFPSRPGERNDFTKYTTEIIRVQNLVRLSRYMVALKASFSGQYASAILPPSEKYLPGGEQYGRGFFSGEVTGDRAAAGSMELQVSTSYDPKLFGESHHVGIQYYVFWDKAHTWANAVSDPVLHLESTGIGIRANLTEWLSTEVEGVNRITRRPNGPDTQADPHYALFFRVVANY